MRYSYWLIVLIIRDNISLQNLLKFFRYIAYLNISVLKHLHCSISIIFCYYIYFFVLFVCCRDFEAGMKCIQTYTFDCMEEKQREHFNSLYVGTNKVVMELCQDGPYQDGKLYNYVILVVIPYRCNYGF